MTDETRRPISPLDDLLVEIHRGVVALLDIPGDPGHFDLASGLEALTSRRGPVMEYGPWQTALKQLIRQLILLDSMRIGTRPARSWAELLAYELESRGRHDDPSASLISRLYRGVAGVARRDQEIALNNVHLAWQQRHLLQADDLCYALWALTSAAIQQRDLTVARRFAASWLDRSRQHVGSDGCLQARLFVILLDLLTGQPSAACAAAEELSAGKIAGTWAPVARLLSLWLAPPATIDRTRQLDNWPAAERHGVEFQCAVAFCTGGPVDASESRPSIPFVLGERWCEPQEDRDDFAFLCQIRGRYRREQDLVDLSDERLEQLVDCLAHWNLRLPLRQCEIILKDRLPHRYYRSLLSRQLGHHVCEELLDNTGAAADGAQQVEVTVFMMDVQGYSTFCETVDASEIFDFLTPVFKVMQDELRAVGGMLHEFVGDCIMVVFNSAASTLDQGIGLTPPPTPVEILCCTARCLRRNDMLATLLALQGRPILQFGIGVHRGSAAKSFLGGIERCHLGVLGNTVNLSARLEALTRKLPSPIAVTAEMLGARWPDLEGNQHGNLPDFWQSPDDINFSLRYLGEYEVKNIARPVPIFGVHSLLRFCVDFVPMGYVASPEPNVVYMDTGCSLEPGIIDTHFEPRDGVPTPHAASACELLLAEPQRLLFDHLGLDPGNARVDHEAQRIEFRVHSQPDLDCCACLYTAYEFLSGEPRRERLQELAAYAGAIDKGTIPEPQHLADSLYGVFIAHVSRTQSNARKAGRAPQDLDVLQAGLRVIDAAALLADFLTQQGETPALANIFAAQPTWFAEERKLIRDDYRTYREHDWRKQNEYQAFVRSADSAVTGPVTGLWIDHPQSLLFKHWARTDTEADGGRGYGFMAVDLSTAAKSRFVISVAPDTGVDLAGLGETLEAAEARRREQLGQQRPVEPRRFPCDNADPWYCGWGHDFTIIDSPFAGTVLTAVEVKQIHQQWRNGTSPRGD